MRISLVQAPRWSVFTPSYAVALLTGNLRSRGFTVFQRGYDVDFYNAVDAEQKQLWHNENAAFWNDEQQVKGMIADYGGTLDRLVDDVLRDEPTVVGFSVKIWSQWFSEAMAERIRRRDPKIMILFGGPQTGAVNPEEYLARHAEVDALCIKEADISLPNFLAKMQAAGGRPCEEPGFVYRTAEGAIVNCGTIQKIPQAIEVPFADYSDYDFSQYHYSNAITMLMSRGCINRCSYCSEAPHFLRFRAYPAERIFEELMHHWEHTNCGRPMRVFFNDSLLNGNMKVLEELADLLIAHRDRVQIDYGGMMLIRDEMTEELVSKLARSGCSDILFGLETGSEVVLKKMRKRYKHSTAEQVFKRCHDHKIRVVASVIFGHPGETEAEFHKSLRFLRANAHNIDLFLLNYMGIYGQSDIAMHPEKYGLDPEMAREGNDWVGDGGLNTFEIRNERVNLARAILGDKVSDIGGFYDGDRPLYEPRIPYKQRIEQLHQRLEEARERCRQTLQAQMLDVVQMPSERPLGMIETLEAEQGRWRARGWALDPHADGPAKEVVLINHKGRMLAYCRVERERDDVAAVYNNSQLQMSGWETFVPAAELEPGTNVVRAFVFDPQANRAYRLQGEFAVQVA